MRALPLLLLLPGVALAQAVPNGTFADSSAWTSSGVNGGYASFVTQGTQFSSVETTTGIVFPSPQYARNVRSSGPAPTNSVGILTSDTFVLTKPTVQWKQISERTGVNIVFRLLDGASAQLSTAGVTPSDGAWATQTFNASAWCGRTVRVEFRQNTLNAGSGWFTLIDDVTLTGSTCSDFVDTDRDGTCPAGRDLNADGDCADAGEQTTPYDCAEGDAGRGGLQAEVTGNDVDEDCDGAVVCWRDNDHDGYGSGTVTSADGDCGDVGEARQAGDCDDG
ncbi:MAG TPA: hypothetical protein PKA64_11920, partial [Myxococcota bacterium]|nr:hypothetical protein [Myxococcota bacterium]